MAYKSIKSFIVVAIFVLAFICRSASASDTEYIFRWVPGQFGINIDLANAGVPTFVEARYESALKRLQFEVNVAPTNFSMQAFALVVTDGPYPHYGGGQYAVYYFDATNLSNPILSVYPYNGNDDQNDSLSYLDARIDLNTQLPPQFRCGAPCSGIQDPNRICTSLNPSACPGWLQSLSAQSESDGSRTFRFTVNTSIINAFPISYPNWLNPALYSWQGTTVGSNIGVCVRGYGLLNGPVTYRSDGYIQDLPVPIGNHHMSIFGTCLLAPPTFREPYCEGPSGTQTVQVGENFSSTFRGVSPDNKVVTVTYAGIPSGAVVTPASGSSAQGTLNGSFNWTPASNQQSATYSIMVNYQQSDGVTFSCPFSIQVPGLGCADADISELLFSLDSLAHQQSNNVRKFARRYVKVTKGTSLEKSAKRLSKNSVKQADALFNESWGIIWTVPQVVTSCTNAPFCVTTSHASTLTEFNNNTDELYALSIKLNNLIRKARSSAKKLLAEAESLRSQSLATSATVPTSTTSCG